MKTVIVVLHLFYLETQMTHHHNHRGHVTSLLSSGQSTSSTTKSMNMYNFRPPSDFLSHKEFLFGQEKWRAPPHPPQPPPTPLKKYTPRDLIPMLNVGENDDESEDDQENSQGGDEEELSPIQPPPHHKNLNKNQNPASVYFFDEPAGVGVENEKSDDEPIIQSQAYDFFEDLDSQEDLDMMEGFYEELENYLPKTVTTRKPPRRRPHQHHHQPHRHHYEPPPKNNFTFKRPFMAKPEFPLPHLPPNGPPKAAWNYVNVHSIRSAHDSNGISEIGGQNVTTMWSIAPHGGFIMTEERRKPPNITMVTIATNIDNKVSMMMKAVELKNGTSSSASPKLN